MNLLEVIPDLGALLLHELAGLFYRRRKPFMLQPVEQEGLEQFESHLLGKTALMDSQLRANDDDGTAGVVHPLAEEVLAEPALLPLERVRRAI